MSEPRHVAALDRVLELAALINTDLTRSLHALGLTPARTHLLWAVGRTGPATHRALATALDVSPRNITGLVDGLERDGFVAREPHPSDRRAMLVMLTARGAEVFHRMQADQQVFADLLFADMPPRRFASFVRGLDDVLAVLRTQIGSPELPDA